MNPTQHTAAPAAQARLRDMFRDPVFVGVLLLGFSSGLPLALTGGTLQAWMAVEGVDLKTIGIFTLVGLPYTWKFVWAPLMDRFAPPLGRRRGWILIAQFALVAGLLVMGATRPKEATLAMAVIAVLVAFSSASQDIAIDAWRTDSLKSEQRGLGAALAVTGYRIAMLISGALALRMADAWGWQTTYWIMAALIGASVIVTLLAREPTPVAGAPRTLQQAVVEPFQEFFSRHGAWSALLLIVLYKLGDAFAVSLSTAFLLRGVGFDLVTVGDVNKFVALVASIIGGILGGVLMLRMSLYRALFWFGVLQAVSNLGYAWLALAGKDLVLLVGVIAFDNGVGGMGNAAFAALVMALTDKRFSATQFALLSALAAFGRVYVGPASGFLVEAYGWMPFFVFSFVIALPGVALVWLMRKRIGTLSGAETPSS